MPDANSASPHRAATPGAQRADELHAHPERREDHEGRRPARLQPSRDRESLPRRARTSRTSTWSSASAASARTRTPPPSPWPSRNARNWKSPGARTTSAASSASSNASTATSSGSASPPRGRLRHAPDVHLARPRNRDGLLAMLTGNRVNYGITPSAASGADVTSSRS